MNKTEQMAFEWLKKQGYKEGEIIFNSNRSPDFICKDRRYEVKYLYGDKLIFSTPQIKNLKEKDFILVFNRNGFFNKFIWKEKNQTMFNIIIADNKNGITIKVSDEIWKKLNKMKKRGETFNNVLNRVLKITNSKSK